MSPQDDLVLSAKKNEAGGACRHIMLIFQVKSSA